MDELPDWLKNKVEFACRFCIRQQRNKKHDKYVCAFRQSGFVPYCPLMRRVISEELLYKRMFPEN